MLTVLLPFGYRFERGFTVAMGQDGYEYALPVHDDEHRLIDVCEDVYEGHIQQVVSMVTQEFSPSAVEVGDRDRCLFVVTMERTLDDAKASAILSDIADAIAESFELTNYKVEVIDLVNVLRKKTD
jgi:hypothetical protein